MHLKQEVQQPNTDLSIPPAPQMSLIKQLDVGWEQR